MDDDVVGIEDEEGGSLWSSLTTAANASGLRPISHRATRTERVWRSSPVSRMFDMWNARSRDSRAVRAASGSMRKDFNSWFLSGRKRCSSSAQPHNKKSEKLKTRGVKSRMLFIWNYRDDKACKHYGSSQKHTKESFYGHWTQPLYDIITAEAMKNETYCLWARCS